ncbi:MAG: hypothetical protein ACYDAO_00785 [Thermoplasmataceae archaeon]
MKEPKIMVANRTHRLSNHRCESSEDKASASASWGCTEMRASNQAIVIVNEFCSAVIPTTRIQFKWNDECDEPVASWRNQHFQTRWVYASGKHSDVKETAWLQGLVGKAGKDLGHRRLMGECVMLTPLVVQGLADVVVVAVKPPIIKRKSKGPLGMVVFGIADGQAIALRARSRYLTGLSHWKGIVPEPLHRRRNVHQTEREGCM